MDNQLRLLEVYATMTPAERYYYRNRERKQKENLERYHKEAGEEECWMNRHVTTQDRWLRPSLWLGDFLRAAVHSSTIQSTV